MKDQTLKTRVAGKYDESVSVEESIRRQIQETQERFVGEVQRQQRYQESRSIRGCAMIDFKGGKFVLDMRLLPDAEVEDDELYRSVKEILSR